MATGFHPPGHTCLQRNHLRYPKSTVSGGRLGVLYLLFGRLEQAVAILREVVSQPDATPELYCSRGIALNRIEEVSQARAVLQRVLEMSPSQRTEGYIRQELESLSK